MSKLKRRKTAVEEIKSEQQFRIKDQNESLRIPDAALQRRAEGSPVGEGFSCWTLSALSDVEKLWMETLQALSPHFPAQEATLPVPQLPSLNTKEDKQHDHRWCSLDEDVIPFPNPLAPYSLPHSAPSSSSPGFSPNPQDRSGHIATHRAPSSLHQGSDRSDVRVCEQYAEGKSGSGAEHSGPESPAEAGAGTLDTSKIKSRAIFELGIKSGLKTEMNNDAGTSVRGTESDGLRLERCPMCLMQFPAKFSQMECDGHLAQCLSEMNVDVMW